MGEEHPLTLGAVVARAQVVLGGVAVDLVVDEEVDRKKRPYLRRFAIVPRGSMTRREQLAWRRNGKGVNNGT